MIWNPVKKTRSWITFIFILTVFFFGCNVIQTQQWSKWQQTQQHIHSKSLNEWEDNQEERKQLLREMCRHYLPDAKAGKLKSYSRQLHHMIVDDYHKLIYCFVPKVGCTNWKKVFMKLTGKTKVANLSLIDHFDAHNYLVLKKLSYLKEKDILYRLGHYTKFVFVRHPFERLVSAYRDKFLSPKKTDKTLFHGHYGRSIIKQYRNNASNESLSRGHDVTFPEFVRYLIDRKSKSANYEAHWRPMVDLCAPCHVHYDIIGKYETLTEDASFVLNKAGVGDMVQYPKSDNLSSTSSLVEQYMNMLTPEQRRQLYEIYEKDYKFFNYNFNG